MPRIFPCSPWMSRPASNADTGEPQEARPSTPPSRSPSARRNLGCCLQGSVPHVGQLEVLDNVSLIPCPFTSELNWTLPEDFTDFPPRRQITAHKGSFGHLAAVAPGSFGYHGAAVLAVRGRNARSRNLSRCSLRKIFFTPSPRNCNPPWCGCGKRRNIYQSTPPQCWPGRAWPRPPRPMTCAGLVRRFWRDLPAP